MKQEQMTLTPHWGDRARDAYWSNPTKAQAAALFAFGLALFTACVAVVA